MYGGLEGRGTQQAMLRVYGARAHLKSKRVSSATYLSDIKMAFDKVNRRKALKQVKKQLKDKEFSAELRHVIGGSPCVLRLGKRN